MYADKVEYLSYLEIINNDISVDSHDLSKIFENPEGYNYVTS